MTSQHPSAPTIDTIRAWLTAQVAELLDVPAESIDPAAPLESFGLASRDAVVLSGDLEVWLGRRVAATLVYDYPNINLIAEHLGRSEQVSASAPRFTEPPVEVGEPIAIIGMGCRFPMANGPESFWQLVRDGVDAISEIPPERWDVDAFYDPQHGTPGKMITRWGGIVPDVDRFDPQFFGISPREVETMDPQQRLALEIAWEAIEDAGLPIERVAGSRTGVYLGINNHDYSLQLHMPDLAEVTPYIGTGNAFSVAANRISYALDLHGPSMAVDTACSSSLVTTHLAVQSLRSHESDLALSIGVNIVLQPDITVVFSQAHMMAADGRCKTFDARADGYVRGDGCGAIVLKRLSDAQRDGDRIYAVIHGTAINQDGRSNGLTAPNGLAQQAVVRTALRAAGIAPADVDYIEAHGTGTALGDPIEVNALGEVMAGRSLDQPCWIASAKTNIGHLESAAGIAGTIKAALALANEEIPPHRNFEQINPQIPLDELPFAIPLASVPWPRGERARYVGVSAFGFGGTNAHIVLGEAPAVVIPANRVERPAHVLALAAKDEAGLAALAGRMAAHLRVHPEQPLADVCYTLNTGRSQFDERAALVAATTGAMAGQLAALAAGDAPKGGAHAHVRAAKAKVGFLFSGQGAQYGGMGRELFETQPIFRSTLENCDEILRGIAGWSLLDLLFTDSARIDETEFTQPALFAVEVALARLWQSWGVAPAVMLGHSVGEYAAAHIAGAYGLEDGLRLIAARGRLMQALPRDGTMIAIFAALPVVAAAIAPHRAEVAIAAVNGPDNIVISGQATAVEQVAEQFRSRGVETRPLAVSHAFHSPLIEPMLDEFTAIARTIAYQPVQIPFVSNVTGRIFAVGDRLDATYWRNHVRQAVQFESGVRAMAQIGCDVFIEIGPQPVLAGMGRRCLPDLDAAWLPSLRQNKPAYDVLLESLSKLWVRGAAVDWAGFDAPYHRQRLTLPTYPFQRRSFIKSFLPEGWRSGAASATTSADHIHPLLHRRLRSPLIKDIVFESTLAHNSPAWLPDHVIYDAVIFPGTAYVELIAAAAREALTTPAVLIENLALHEAIFLSADAALTLQTTVAPDANGVKISVYRLDPDADDESEAWKLHATASARPDDSVALAAPFDPDAVQARCADEIAPDAFYATCHDNGLMYGPAFRGNRQIWRRDGEALARVQLPERTARDADRYIVHPALLDACLQLTVAALNENFRHDATLYLPVAIERFRPYASGVGRVWAHLTLRPIAGDRPNVLIADIILFDEQGQRVAELTGLRTMRTTRAALLGARAAKQYESWLYEPVWRVQKLPVGPGNAAVEPGLWLIFADAQGAGEGVARALSGYGETAHIVRPGDAFARTADAHTVRPFAPEDFVRTLAEIAAEQARPLRGVLYLWSLDADARNAADAIMHGPMLAGALHLAQALARGGQSPRLWLITRGGQSVSADAPDPAQTALWGLGRVIALEQPDLRCTRVDLDPNSANMAALLAELFAGDAEDQIAYRGDERYVARLARSAAGPDALADQPVRLEIPARGALDNLTLAPMTRIPPGWGQVEIEVRAAGLNFRDVMNALGLYPGDPGLLGGECAGRVTAVGEGVEHVRVGDDVIAIAPGSFGAYTTTHADLVARKPAGLSFEEAAAIPIVFLTAHYSLNRLAGMQAGDVVFIPSAAGGVGLAAIQLAHAAGAIVIATASSEAKRQHLLAMGVRHVLPSRTLDFAAQVMELTDGRGVDIVLNSLSGEYIPKSLDILAANGRFVEIGKVEIWDAGRVAAFRDDIAYFVVALDTLSSERPDVIRALYGELLPQFEAGRLAALPVISYPVEDAQAAFRLMAQARHIGKIVITQKSPITIRPDATYLITGGLGALGQKLARWLVLEKGARRLVLTGRSAPSAQAQALFDELEAAGADILVSQTDIAVRTDVEALFAQLASDAGRPPLRGVIHAAGVLDDGVLIQQSWERFQHVLAPKVAGAWHLHELTRPFALDFQVYFSSVASLLGSPGQGNYAAANAFMDGLAAAQRAAGQRALSINWGPWAEVGMAASSMGAQRRRSDGGMAAINPEQGVEVFGRVLARPAAQLGVMPVDWAAFARRLGANRPAFLAELLAPASAPKSPDAKTDDFASELASTAEGEREALAITYLRGQIGRVLGIDGNTAIDIRQPLSEMGLDSLMAIEIKTALDRVTGRTLPPTIVFEYPTIESLARYLITQIAVPDQAPTLPAQTDVAPPDSDPTEAPLSFGQRALWFQQQVAPESIFNPTYAVRLRAPLDLDLLQRAANILAQRHASLRTRFINRKGQPVQVIDPRGDIPINVINAEGATDAQVQAALQKAASEPFDLENGPLLHAYVLSRAANDHILLLAAHHIVVDLWSLTVLVNELGILLVSQGDASRLPALPVEYADFTAGQAQRLAGADGDALLAYWREQLGGAPTILDLPTDHARPATQTHPGATRSLRLDATLTNQLRSLSQKHGATLFTTLLAAFDILLQRYSGHDDILVGTAINGRTQAELANLVGYLVNPLPLRAHIDDKQPFVALLDQVRQTVVEALKHQDYPFGLLVEKLQPERNPAFMPMFQVMFVFQRAQIMHDQGLSELALSTPGAQITLGAWEVEAYPLEQQNAPFDLTLMMAEGSDGLVASFNYNTDLYEAKTIERLLDQFRALLSSIVAHPDRPIAELPLLSEHERAELIGWGRANTSASPFAPVYRLFEAQVERTPNAIALVSDDEQVSYRELNRRANELARYLRQAGVGPETIVAICLERSPWVAIAMLAVMKAGGAYLPIDPSYPTERQAYMLADARPGVLITNSDLNHRLPPHEAHTVVVDAMQRLLMLAPNANLDIEVEPDNLAYVIYTSGSTGKPKGVLAHHRGLTNLVRQHSIVFAIDYGMQYLQFSSFSFDASVTEVFTALTQGATLHIARQDALASPLDLAHLLRERKITAVTLPPTMLKALSTADLPHLQKIISAGERCPVEVGQRWGAGRRLVNGYGPTETTIGPICYVLDGPIDNLTSVPIGRPIANMTAHVLDTAGQIVPVGVPGELYIGGIGVTRGYLNRPDLTAERFIPDPFSDTPGERLYRTGDIVRFVTDPHGERVLEFLRRADQQVKLRGFRVELGEIESALRQHPDIADAAVIVRNDNGSEARLVSYIISDAAPTTTELRQFLSRALPDYMIPAAYVTLDHLPLSPNGKLDIRALPVPTTARPELAAAYVAPRNDLERTIARIWRDVLRLDTVGVYDNFFDLGGHSLLLAQVHAGLQESFMRTVNVVELFRYPTISALAEFLNPDATVEQPSEQVQSRAEQQRQALLSRQRQAAARSRHGGAK